MTLVDALDWAARIMVWSVVLPATLFAVLFAGRRSNWRATPAGRAVMYLVVTIDAVLVFGLLRSVLPDWVADSLPLLLVRFGVYLALAVSVWRMPFELIRQQRRGPVQPAAHDADTDPRIPVQR